MMEYRFSPFRTYTVYIYWINFEVYLKNNSYLMKLKNFISYFLHSLATFILLLAATSILERYFRTSVMPTFKMAASNWLSELCKVSLVDFMNKII